MWLQYFLKFLLIFLTTQLWSPYGLLIVVTLMMLYLVFCGCIVVVIWSPYSCYLDDVIFGLLWLHSSRNVVTKAPFSSRKFLTLSKIQNMKIFNVF